MKAGSLAKEAKVMQQKEMRLLKKIQKVAKKD